MKNEISEEAILSLIQNGKKMSCLKLSKHSKYSKKFLLEMRQHVLGEMYWGSYEITPGKFDKIPDDIFKE